MQITCTQPFACKCWHYDAKIGWGYGSRVQLLYANANRNSGHVTWLFAQWMSLCPISKSGTFWNLSTVCFLYQENTWTVYMFNLCLYDSLYPYRLLCSFFMLFQLMITAFPNTELAKFSGVLEGVSKRHKFIHVLMIHS